MAQAATMGPPLSPREIRRSGRRSAPSVSTSASKSPESDLPPKQKDPSHRPAHPASASARNKRSKDDPEDHADDRRAAATPPTAHPPSSSSTATSATTTSSSAGGKGKRKNNRDKDKHRLSIDVTAEALQEPPDDKSTEAVDEEEQGVTRCVCGSNGEDEADAGEFMVQCETCKVWQHGLCMGYDSEDQVHDADYYCEQCRPELHVELLKKLAKKTRQSSTVSHGPAASRVSRSRSPSHVVKKPSGRRNTMNSRDAAFDESLKEIIEATAAEAAAAQESATQQQPTPTNGVQPDVGVGEDVEAASNNRKKRKRIEDDASSKKRTRSASSASDQQPPPIPSPPTPPIKTAPQPTAPISKTNTRTKRNARKIAPVVDVPAAPAALDGDDATQPAATTTTTTTTTTKRQGASARSKGSGGTKRPPISHSNSHGNNSMGHEQQPTSRRGGGGGGQSHHNTNGQGGTSALESSRAYRNSHAYAVSQQPLFTSWGLPDYLAHLEEMLPSITPQPLEIQSNVGSAGGGGSGGGRESTEMMTMERGVKVKWPSKRMSVVDMNKRVRALVEWVGREQANALDRERRREALEVSLKVELELSGREGAAAAVAAPILGDDAAMAVDGAASAVAAAAVVVGSQAPAKSAAAAAAAPVAVESEHESSSRALWKTADGKPMSTMKMMEELMEELIGFQERFGPGAKVRERERRSAITS